MIHQNGPATLETVPLVLIEPGEVTFPVTEELLQHKRLTLPGAGID